MRKFTSRLLVFLGSLGLLLSTTGCAGLFEIGRVESRSQSSVVEYLYPGKTHPVVEAKVPELRLPLDVGIAFVPGTGADDKGLSEEQKLGLMQRISAEFENVPWVHSIERIPSIYLVPQGSFDNLDQLHTMYGIDVIALLSYDQVQHTDEGLLSITYWTLVGAYLFKGEKNDTSTMVDAAVYHIPSREMLFRAPGTSRIAGSATPVNLPEQLRKDSYQGFELAVDNLIGHLDAQLETFTQKVKESPERYAVSRRPGFTGGGSVGGLFSVILASAIGGALCASRARRT